MTDDRVNARGSSGARLVARTFLALATLWTIYIAVMTVIDDVDKFDAFRTWLVFFVPLVAIGVLVTLASSRQP